MKDHNPKGTQRQDVFKLAPKLFLNLLTFEESSVKEICKKISLITEKEALNLILKNFQLLSSLF